MTVSERPEALGRLPDGYSELFDRARSVLAADDRVRAMWIGGSLARGEADEASDLDLLVAVRDDDLEELASTWRELLAEITPTVLAKEQWFAKGSFWSITPRFERFDVVVEGASTIPTTLFPTRTVVFDHDGLDAQLPPASLTPPSAGVVAGLVEDWFHFSAMLETILWRADWLLAAEHLHFLRDLLYKLYVEGNKPQPPSGLKRWSEKLTDVQRVILEQLPTAAHDRASVIDAHLALSQHFLPTARHLAASVGAIWPTRLEQAATDHLRDVLDIPTPYPENQAAAGVATTSGQPVLDADQ